MTLYQVKSYHATWKSTRIWPAYHLNRNGSDGAVGQGIVSESTPSRPAKVHLQRCNSGPPSTDELRDVVSFAPWPKAYPMPEMLLPMITNIAAFIDGRFCGTCWLLTYRPARDGELFAYRTGYRWRPLSKKFGGRLQRTKNGRILPPLYSRCSCKYTTLYHSPRMTDLNMDVVKITKSALTRLAFFYL